MTSAPDAAITICAMFILASLAIFACDRGISGPEILWAVIGLVAAKGGYSLGKTSGTTQAVQEISDCLQAGKQVK